MTEPGGDLPVTAAPMGGWVEDAACAALGSGADLFTGDKPDADDLALCEAICNRCDVRQPCADYAGRAQVWGFWAGRWHTGRLEKKVPA